MYLNETLKTIAERYSCRDFKNEPVSDEMLQAIADAAIQAPSGMNRQAWHFSVVSNKTLLGELESEGMSQIFALEDKTVYDRIMERGGKLFYDAPAAVYIGMKSGSGQMDCGIACQNIALAASSLGLGNVICVLAGFSFAVPEKAKAFADKLGFPEGYEFGIAVLIGHAKKTVEAHKPNSEKVTFVK